MKKIRLLIFGVFAIFCCFAQKKINSIDSTIKKALPKNNKLSYDPVVSTLPSYYDCQNLVSSNLNLIINPKMLVSSNYPFTQASQTDAFGQGYITDWKKSHGTPPIFVYQNIPGFDNNVTVLQANLSYSNGIVGKIQPLISGHNYLLQFDFQNSWWSSEPAYVNRDFNIYLIKCTDANTYFTNPSSYNYPVIPPNTQQVYCDHDFMFGGGYQSVSFIANSEYNMI